MTPPRELATTRLATSVDGKPWDNQELIEELRDVSTQSTGQWAVWHWHNPATSPSALEIVVFIPEHSSDKASSREFLDAVSRQLKRAFSLFCSERGWPEPGSCLERAASPDDEWRYRISLAGGPSAQGELKPAKLLAMGDHTQLGPLLGLETLDPVLGLPAKWIGRSQMEPAQAAQLHLFDAPGLIAAHTLHLIGEIWQSSFGFVELQRWLLPALPGHTLLINEILPRHAGLFLATVKELIADHLWLPHPAQFLELFLATLPELAPEEALDAELLKELLRKEIVPFNLERFCDEDGMLFAVEWKGEPEGDGGTQSRLLARLADALTEAHESSGRGQPVVITDLETRSELSQVLKGPFAYLPVLSWAELPAHCRVDLVAVVDARFEVDPSPWLYASFQVEAGPP